MEAEALQEGRAVFSLDLHPAYSNNALQGVLLQLQAKLLRWDDDLGGVLLSYKNLEKLPHEAPIRPYFPYIQLKVRADVLLFKPKVGQTLCGQVTKVGADFIGMTLLGTVNAAVGRQNIRSGLRHNDQRNSWESHASSDGRIEVGGDMLFTVDRLRIETNGVLAVMGSLKEPWTGSTRQAARTWPQAFSDPAKWHSPGSALLLSPAEPTISPEQLAQQEEAQPPNGPEQDLAQTPQSVQLAQDVLAQTPADSERSQKKKRKRSDIETATDTQVPVQNKGPQPNQPDTNKKRQKKVKFQEMGTEPNGYVQHVTEVQEPDQSDATVIDRKVARKKRKAEKQDAASLSEVGEGLIIKGAAQGAGADNPLSAGREEEVKTKTLQEISGSQPVEGIGKRESASLPEKKKEKRKKHMEGLPNGFSHVEVIKDSVSAIADSVYFSKSEQKSSGKKHKKKRRKDAE